MRIEIPDERTTMECSSLRCMILIPSDGCVRHGILKTGETHTHCRRRSTTTTGACVEWTVNSVPDSFVVGSVRVTEPVIAVIADD